jgi:hypothetical protein
MPGDHEDVHKHWWGKYVHKLSTVAESYETKHRWGDETINRATGEKIWEPMPLVTPFPNPPPISDLLRRTGSGVWRGLSGR